MVVVDSVLPTQTPTIQWLAGMPRSERREALESVVVAEFKTILLMTTEDELSREQSFFDLGLTSLRLTEVKQRLDTLLGRATSANSLFNQPTVAALIKQLCDEVLPELFADPPSPPNRAPVTDSVAVPAAEDRALVDNLLQDMYRM